MTASATSEAINGMFTRGMPAMRTCDSSTFRAATLSGRPMSNPIRLMRNPPRKNICTTWAGRAPREMRTPISRCR